MAIDITSKIVGFRSRAVGWRIIVQVDEVEEKTKGGLIIPDTVKDQEQEREMFGRVVELGPMAYQDPKYGGDWCKPGDLLLFSKYAGMPWIENNKVYRAINDEDVICRFERIEEE